MNSHYKAFPIEFKVSQFNIPSPLLLSVNWLP